MKNDVSCILDMRMHLFEHQSSVNPNIPLRDLFYVARLYEKFTIGKDLYSSTRIMLPTPRFIIFYNGVTPQPERRIMKLSDSFQHAEDINLEVIVTQLNINPGFNQELMNGCPTLHQYMFYVEKVRNYNKTMPIEDAVSMAVNECIKEDILADFFRKNKAEAIQMSIFEYDEELHKNTLREEGRMEGRTEGCAESILCLLGELGTVPDDVRQTILGVTDEQRLHCLLKLAAKIDSFDEYKKRMVEIIE